MGTPALQQEPAVLITGLPGKAQDHSGRKCQITVKAIIPKNYKEHYVFDNYFPILKSHTVTLKHGYKFLSENLDCILLEINNNIQLKHTWAIHFSHLLKSGWEVEPGSMPGTEKGWGEYPRIPPQYSHPPALNRCGETSRGRAGGREEGERRWASLTRKHMRSATSPRRGSVRIR